MCFLPIFQNSKFTKNIIYLNTESSTCIPLTQIKYHNLMCLKRARDMKGLKHILVMILEHIVRRHIRVCILKILRMS